MLVPSEFLFGRQNVPKAFLQASLASAPRGIALASFSHLALPFYSGDTPYYEELARNWLYHGVYGFYSHGQLLPSDARMPGYPAFLAIIYFWAGPDRKAVMLVQAFVDLGTGVLAAGIARAWRRACLRRVAVALPRQHFGWRPSAPSLQTTPLCRSPKF